MTRRIASCVVEAKRKIASTFGYTEDTEDTEGEEDTEREEGEEGKETVY